MMLRNILLFCVTLCAAGCAGKNNFQVNPGFADEEMLMVRDQHYAYCDSYAKGNSGAALAALKPLPPRSYTAYSSGTISGGFAGQQYNYTARTYVDNSQAYAQTGMHNLGFAMGYAIGVSNRRSECMRALGWKKNSELTADDANKMEISSFLYKGRSDPMFAKKEKALHAYIRMHSSRKAYELQMKYANNIEAYKDFFVYIDDEETKHPGSMDALIHFSNITDILSRCAALYDITVSMTRSTLEEKYQREYEGLRNDAIAISGVLTHPDTAVDDFQRHKADLTSNYDAMGFALFMNDVDSLCKEQIGFYKEQVRSYKEK